MTENIIEFDEEIEEDPNSNDDEPRILMFDVSEDGLVRFYLIKRYGIEGIILDKERVHEGMPKHIKNAKIALINAALEVKKKEVDARIQINDPTQLQAFLDEEEGMIKKMVEKVKNRRNNRPAQAPEKKGKTAGIGNGF